MSIASIINSWFPIVRSADLKKGQSYPLPVLGHELVLFRSLDNSVGLLKRQCPHMGGDLSRGQVSKSGIACPIHQWEFAPNGKRLITIKTNNKTNDTSNCIHASTCQPSIPCTERWGIVFGYFGDQPFKLPETQKEVFISPPAVRDLNMHYTVPSLFGFDTEHFSTVHHRELADLTIYQHAPHHIGTAIKFLVGNQRWSDRVLRRLGLKEIETDVDYWGGNILLGRHNKTRTYALITTLPLDEHRSKIFVVTMQEKPTGGLIKKSLSWCRFQLSRPLTNAFIRQDEKALNGVRFDANTSKKRTDNAMQHWLSHVETMPSTATKDLLNR